MGLGLPHEADSQQRGQDRDGRVDGQAPAPREVLGEHAAEQQSDRGTTAGDGAEDAEGLGSLLGIVERHRDQRECSGCQQCGENALQCARAEEQLRVHRHTAERGGGSEAQQSDQECLLAAHEVGDATPEQQEPAERQRVRGHHPLHVLRSDTQIRLRAGDGQVHDRRIEHDHELGDRDHEQRSEAVRVGDRYGGIGDVGLYGHFFRHWGLLDSSSFNLLVNHPLPGLIPDRPDGGR